MKTPVTRLLRDRPQVVSIHPEANVREAVNVMLDNNVGSLIVFDSDDDLVGIFTERDLLRRVVGKNLDPGTTKISAVMTREVRVVESSASRQDVLFLMENEHIRHVPIVGDAGIVGLVSLRDVLRSENAEKDFEISQLKGYISDKPYPSYPG